MNATMQQTTDPAPSAFVLEGLKSFTNYADAVAWLQGRTAGSMSRAAAIRLVNARREDLRLKYVGRAG